MVVPQKPSSEVHLMNEVNRSNSERGLTRRQAIILGSASIVLAILLSSPIVLETVFYHTIALVFYVVSIILFIVGILFFLFVVIIREDEE